MSFWSKIAQFNGQASGDWAGTSVTLSNDGTTIAIGSPYNDNAGNNFGQVRIYKYNGTSWNNFGQFINGKTDNELSGIGVSFNNDGTVVAIGASQNDGNGIDSGVIRIYEYDNSISDWKPKGQDIFGFFQEDRIGTSISLNSDGNIIAFGSINNDTNGENRGYTCIYKYNPDPNVKKWELLGSPILGESTADESGYSVSLSSNGFIVCIGAPLNDGISTNIIDNRGHARVYEFNGSNWQQLGQDIDGNSSGDFFGYNLSCSNDGKIVAIGGLFNNNRGHVRVFKYNPQLFSWELYGNEIIGEQMNEWSGWSVSLNANGTILAFGAPHNANSTGAVRVYEYNINTNKWDKRGNNILGEQNGELSGYSVSINDIGNIVSVGAVHNNINGFTSGTARIYKYFETLDYTKTQNLTYYNDDIVMRFTSAKTNISLNANINDNRYTKNSGIAYCTYTGFIGVVTRFSVSAIDENGNNITNFISQPITIELTLPMANTSHTLKLFKLDENNQKDVNGIEVTYNPTSNKWNTTLTILSSFIIQDMNAVASGVGGDPHVMTILGKHTLLPNDWKLVKLYQHNDMKVVAKCEHINDEVIEKLHKLDEDRKVISIDKYIHKYVSNLTYITELFLLDNNKEVFKIDLLNGKVLLHNEETKVFLEKIENDEGLFSLTHKRMYPKQNLSSYLLHLDSNNILKVQVDNFWDDINFVQLNLFDMEHKEEYSGEFFRHDEQNRLL